MKKTKDPLLVALKEGKSYTWTMPDGGNFASMRMAIKYGQTLTMAPIGDLAEIQQGDIVLVKWHKSHMFHIVGEISEGKYLIVNSLGGVNGWVNGEDILGRVTAKDDPAPHPGVPVMLVQLFESYEATLNMVTAPEEDQKRLMGIVEELRWYSGRIGEERWLVMPRSNKWTFEQNLYRLTRQIDHCTLSGAERVQFLIDCGKICVGLAGEIFALFEYDELDWKFMGH